MNIEKAKIKEAVMLSVGSKIEEFLDGAEHRLYEAKGAQKALLSHVRNLSGLMAAAKEDFDKQEIPLESQKIFMDWLQKTLVATQNYAQHFVNQELNAAGEISAFKASHDFLKKTVDGDRQRVAELLKALETGDVIENEDGSLETVSNNGSRIPGTRPGPSIAQLRRQEEITKEVSPVPAADAANTPEEKSPKRRAPRRSRTKKLSN